MNLSPRLLFCVGCLGIAGHSAAADRLYAEFPLASVTVGMHSEVPVKRVLTLGLAGPDFNLSDLDHCAGEALKTVATDVLVPRLQKLPAQATLLEDMESRNAEITAATIAAERNANAVAVTALLAGLSSAAQQQIVKCRGASAEPFAKQTRVIIAMRVCSADSPALCNERPLPDAFQNEAAFEKLWSAFSLDATRPLNVWHEVNADLKVIQAAAIREEVQWPTITQEESIAQFEHYVNWLRARKDRLSYAVPSILELSQQAGIHLLDVIEHPAAVIPYLPEGAVTLQSVSDETARSRIKDCSQLRAQFTAEQVGACAGYQLSELNFYACIRGDRCIPPIVDNALRSMGAIRLPASVAELAAQTMLPRIELGAHTLASIEEQIRSCGATSGDQAVHARCVMKSALEAKDFATYDCASSIGSGSNRSGSILDCAKTALAGKGLDREFACLSDAAADPGAVMQCGLDAELTADQLACVDAFRSSSSTRSTLAKCFSGANARIDSAAACLSDESFSDDQLVMCLAEDFLPDDVNLLYECSRSGDWADASGCILANELELEGEIGRAVSCGLQSGGNAVGTIACYAGDKLNPQQAIALQCAVTTQEPISFSICAGGQLGFLEIMQCRASGGAFKGNCFGKNNEFVRALRFFGIEPGPNSVLADVINVQIEIISFQIAMAEFAAHEVGRFATNVNREIERAVREAKRVGGQLRSIGNRVERRVNKICGKLCR